MARHVPGPDRRRRPDYEPHGSHIFHTEDDEGWELANAMTPFNASRQQCAGTVLGFEFPNAPTRCYPVESERNRALNDRYQALEAAEHDVLPALFRTGSPAARS